MNSRSNLVNQGIGLNFGSGSTPNTRNNEIGRLVWQPLHQMIAMPYFYLFCSALIAATILPLSSEALLSRLLYQHYSPLLLWLTATLGNTLGSCINWYLGKWCLHLQSKKWFPINTEQLARAQVRFQKYGLVSLLFAWVPIIGDPLTVLAGAMRVTFWKFLLLVSIGKGLRYAALIWVALQLI